MVVCGGRDFDYNSGQFYTLNTCISWATGDSRWKNFSNMRCVVMLNKSWYKIHRKARSFHTAWTPSLSSDTIVLLGGGHSSIDLSAEILTSEGPCKHSQVARFRSSNWVSCRVASSEKKRKTKFLCNSSIAYSALDLRTNACNYSDDTFALEHGAYGACGIPDGDTIIMTGGFGHNYVTR